MHSAQQFQEWISSRTGTEVNKFHQKFKCYADAVSLRVLHIITPPSLCVTNLDNSVTTAVDIFQTSVSKKP